MSVKRQATTELNHENWDQDDPTDQEEEGGGFRVASKEVLEKRVIRTAKRRSQVTGDETKKSVFSGFSGFNKAQQSSFDFLANLTNGSKTSNSNGTSTTKSDTTVTSSSNNTKLTTSPSAGIFGLAGTSTPIAKSTFANQKPESSLFGGVTNSAFQQSLFASKTASSGSASPFQIQTTQSSPPATNFVSKTSADIDKAVSKGTTVFGMSTMGSNTSKSFFSSSSTPFKTQEVSKPLTNIVNTPVIKTEAQESKKQIYYSKLKGLNDSVSAWIKKHVEETPLCILTPIFRDYEKHLNDIQDEYEKSKLETTKENTEIKQNSPDKSLNTNSNILLNATKVPSSLFSTTAIIPTKFSIDSGSKTDKTANFTFGVNTTNVSSTSTFSTLSSSTSNSGFSFGVKSPTQNTSPFSSNTTIATGSNSPFSFGIGKPFSFNSNIKKPEEPANEAEEKENEDEPPKVEYTPIVEENSVFDKKCKVFVKKDGNFIDKGVGTLYIKKIEESGKYQLLVRANTTLGNVLLNFILNSAISTQRMGKNNVMMVCIPTPDAKPPPTPILIRVKTSEEADELLETLNNYKA